MPLAPQTILFTNYRIESFLGSGGFAQVYRVHDLILKVPVALKWLSREWAEVSLEHFTEYAARFELEAQLGARLRDCPHLIRVFHFVPGRDEAGIVLELAPGGSLAERLAQARAAQTPLPLTEIIHIARSVARGLAALHALDVVHRDIKPSNILFTANGLAKVADLGLAQLPGGRSYRSPLSRSALAPHPGTPPYMSPEQRKRDAYLTPASDVYALGAVLFEMLTGKVFRSAKPGTPARTLRPDTPAWLDELLMRMTAKDPEARPWDGGEVGAALEAGEQSVKE